MRLIPAINFLISHHASRQLNSRQMKIVILTLGTRGDVQPYAVLGQALKIRGHDVVLSTGKNFEGLAKKYDLEFQPVEADFQALINSDEGKAMMKNPFLARRHFTSIVQPMMVEAMKRFYDLSKNADCVLYHVKSLADYFADQFPGKMMRANVVPAIQPTSEFPNPVFSAVPLPKFLNRFTYKLADLGLAMMNNAIRRFRIASSLGADIPKNFKLPAIYGISPSFLPKPLDFPSDSHFTGFWQGRSPDGISSDVNDFISSQKRTVVITFGSMPFETKFDLQKAILALTEILDVNVLAVKGWGFEKISISDTKSIKIVDSVPYDKVFPKVHAVVHHGGIGTLAECLRAGVPSLSCPVIYPMGDQHFWGKQAKMVGCSPAPIPLKKLTQNKLVDSVRQLLTSERFKINCQKLSNQLATEDGLNNAISVVEKQFGL